MFKPSIEIGRIREMPGEQKSVTWRLTAADGTGFYLKRHEIRHHFEAEVGALNNWGSA